MRFCLSRMLPPSLFQNIQDAARPATFDTSNAIPPASPVALHIYRSTPQSVTIHNGNPLIYHKSHHVVSPAAPCNPFCDPPQIDVTKSKGLTGLTGDQGIDFPAISGLVKLDRKST